MLAALVLLVFPLVPNQPMVQGLLNPQVVLRLVIVLLVIQSLAHVARRLMQARQAVGVVGPGFGLRFQHRPPLPAWAWMCAPARRPPRTQAAGAVLSCVATALHVLVVAATVQPHWLPYLALPALAGPGWRPFGACGAAVGVRPTSPPPKRRCRPMHPCSSCATWC